VLIEKYLQFSLKRILQSEKTSNNQTFLGYYPFKSTPRRVGATVGAIIQRREQLRFEK